MGDASVQPLQEFARLSNQVRFDFEAESQSVSIAFIRNFPKLIDRLRKVGFRIGFL